MITPSGSVNKLAEFYGIHMIFKMYQKKLGYNKLRYNEQIFR